MNNRILRKRALSVHLWELVDDEGAPHADLAREDARQFLEQLSQMDPGTIAEVCETSHPLAVLVRIVECADREPKRRYSELDVARLSAMEGSVSDWVDLAAFVAKEPAREAILARSARFDDKLLLQSENGQSNPGALFAADTGVSFVGPIEPGQIVDPQSRGVRERLSEQRRWWPVMIAAAAVIVVMGSAAAGTRSYLVARRNADAMRRLRAELVEQRAKTREAVASLGRLKATIEEDRRVASAERASASAAIDSLRSGMKALQGSVKKPQHQVVPRRAARTFPRAGQAVSDLSLDVDLPAKSHSWNLIVSAHLGTPEALPYSDAGRLVAFRVRLLDQRGAELHNEVARAYTKVEQKVVRFERALKMTSWDGRGRVVVDQFHLDDTGRVTFRADPSISLETLP